MRRMVNIAIGAFGCAISIYLFRLYDLHGMIKKIMDHDVEIVDMIKDEISRRPRLSVGKDRT